ncbi:Fatty acid-binding protein 2, liver [Holothuria leucospilota]|uniref:Fatty acid-binding protein 2, liver n=1 Tax=Holothuria leucospilota TaxID=206669 RepID=A0A9Q1HCS2_HOLLE|nr:Fatty acid-binding protein 2, liver [Holothuria leucospilota]
MPDFNGTFTVASFDGLKTVLDNFGVPEERRDPAKLQGASVTIKQDGNNFSITTTGGLGQTGTNNFSVPGDYDTELFGRKVKGKVAFEGDALVMRGEGGAVIKREIAGNQMTYTVEFGGASGKIVFNKS